MNLRDYNNQDASRVAKVTRLAFEQYRSEYEEFDLLLKQITDVESYAQLGETIVAEDNGVVVGAVTYVAPNHSKTEYVPREWSIMLMLVVAPDSRGRGIGKLLIDECLSRARRDHAVSIALHTTEIMSVAISMYRKIGFEYMSAGPTIHGVEYGVFALNLNP